MAFRPSLQRLSGGGHFPFPREVWSPAGGWWSQPSNWKANTGVVALGIAAATYGVWSYSADKEWRHTAPTRQIPSMMWARQFTTGQMGIKDESALKGTPSAAHH